MRFVIVFIFILLVACSSPEEKANRDYVQLIQKYDETKVMTDDVQAIASYESIIQSLQSIVEKYPGSSIAVKLAEKSKETRISVALIEHEIFSRKSKLCSKSVTKDCVINMIARLSDQIQDKDITEKNSLTRLIYQMISDKKIDAAQKYFELYLNQSVDKSEGEVKVISYLMKLLELEPADAYRLAINESDEKVKHENLNYFYRIMTEVRDIPDSELKVLIKAEYEFVLDDPFPRRLIFETKDEKNVSRDNLDKFYKLESIDIRYLMNILIENLLHYGHPEIAKEVFEKSNEALKKENYLIEDEFDHYHTLLQLWQAAYKLNNKAFMKNLYSEHSEAILDRADEAWLQGAYFLKDQAIINQIIDKMEWSNAGRYAIIGVVENDQSVVRKALDQLKKQSSTNYFSSYLYDNFALIYYLMDDQENYQQYRSKLDGDQDINFELSLADYYILKKDHINATKHLTNVYNLYMNMKNPFEAATNLRRLNSRLNEINKD